MRWPLAHSKHALFPVPPKRDADAVVLAVSGMDTFELVSQLQRFIVADATLRACA